MQRRRQQWRSDRPANAIKGNDIFAAAATAVVVVGIHCPSCGQKSNTSSSLPGAPSQPSQPPQSPQSAQPNGILSGGQQLDQQSSQHLNLATFDSLSSGPPAALMAYTPTALNSTPANYNQPRRRPTIIIGNTARHLWLSASPCPLPLKQVGYT